MSTDYSHKDECHPMHNLEGIQTDTKQHYQLIARGWLEGGV